MAITTTPLRKLATFIMWRTSSSVMLSRDALVHYTDDTAPCFLTACSCVCVMVVPFLHRYVVEYVSANC